MCYTQLAEAFFGIDAFTTNGMCLKESVHRFIKDLMIARWCVLRGSIAREGRRLSHLKGEVATLWECLSHDLFFHVRLYAEPIYSLTRPYRHCKKPRRKDVHCWMSKAAGVTAILKRYGDKESLKQLDEQCEILGDILSALGLDGEGQCKECKRQLPWCILSDR